MENRKAVNTDFFSRGNYESLIERLESIEPASTRKWGEMTVSQMLHHLNLAIGSGIGFYTLPDVSTFFSRHFEQFILLNIIKKFPIGTKTAEPLKVVDDFDFETEKAQLKKILASARATETDNDWGPHTHFGSMTRNAWGKLIVIHCNHHFQQFSA